MTESSGNGRTQCQCSQDGTKKGDDMPRKCYNCGREGHLAIDRSCPAKGKKCAKCGRYGHFALCCQGKSDNYETGGKPDQRRRGSDRRQSNNANFVGDQDASDSEENCAFAFAVTENQGETCNVTHLKETGSAAGSEY